MYNDETMARLDGLIKDVQDFPVEGVVYKDFTPLLGDAGALALAVELMANPYRGKGIDLVVGAESRGFIFGIAIAQALSAGFVPVRKPGKLPRAVHRAEYELEYRTDTLEIHQDAVASGARVLMVDDLLATGGTMEAACGLVARTGAVIEAVVVLIELEFLNGRDRLTDFGDVHSVLRY